MFLPPSLREMGPPCSALCSKYKFLYNPGTHALRLRGEGFLCSPEGALGFPLCFVALVPGQKSLAKNCSVGGSSVEQRGLCMSPGAWLNFPVAKPRVHACHLQKSWEEITSAHV